MNFFQKIKINKEEEIKIGIKANKVMKEHGTNSKDVNT